MVIVLKSLIAVLGLLLWLWSQKLLNKYHLKHHSESEGKEIQDHVHRWTAGINQSLNQNQRWADALLIVSSLIVDFLGLFLIYQGIFGESLRPLLGLFLLFTLRQLNQIFTSLPTPQGMIWRDPGVPSLLVTYKVSHDLFFSGHTALAVFGAIELMQMGNLWLMTLGAAVIIFEVAVVLLLRAHWTMDVFTGAMAALWVSEICGRLAPGLETWLEAWFEPLLANVLF